MFLVICLLIILVPGYSYASLNNALEYFSGESGKTNYLKVTEELLDDKYYYAASSLIKRALAFQEQGITRARIDKAMDELISEVGFRQFENLPKKILSGSNLSASRYFLAVLYFKEGNYEGALEALAKIPDQHTLRPFALFMEANILSLVNKHQGALLKYEACIESSEKAISDSSHKGRIKQLMINKDYCVIGIPRTQFAIGQYNAANLKYLDLPKSSYIWPEILFEEAWNSFYLKNYNRTLGKLVTYQSPFFDSFFYPEVETLKAFSYLEMCMWTDAKKEVDDYYKNYHSDFEKVKRTFQDQNNSNIFYFKLVTSRMKGEVLNNILLNKIIKSIGTELPFQEMNESYKKGKNELVKIHRLRKSISSDENGKKNNYKEVLKYQLESLNIQRENIGKFVRNSMRTKITQMEESFANMSYIKLEVLQRKKEALFLQKDLNTGERGDIKFLKRNEKQYFWNFNGEFWADELGDYVFALRSEC